MKSADGQDSISDETPRHSDEVLRDKIRFLEEELLRKDQLVEKLRQENELLFRTAIKNSEIKTGK